VSDDSDRIEIPIEDEEAAAGAGEPENGPKIAASDEMEEALRAATASIETRQKQATGGAGEAHPSTDKLTIEMLSNELQSLKEEFDARTKELEEARDRHLRLQAEFENFRRRTLKERQESLQYGHQNLVKDLLAVVDNLERAVEHAQQNSGADLQGILQGVELVQRELLAALGKHGVKRIEAADQPFDPAYHEAMGQVATDAVAPNTVVQVLQTGYLLNDRMLRPARVMVARAADDKQG